MKRIISATFIPQGEILFYVDKHTQEQVESSAPDSVEVYAPIATQDEFQEGCMYVTKGYMQSQGTHMIFTPLGVVMVPCVGNTECVKEFAEKYFEVKRSAERIKEFEGIYERRLEKIQELLRESRVRFIEVFEHLVYSEVNSNKRVEDLYSIIEVFEVNQSGQRIFSKIFWEIIALYQNRIYS